MKLKFIILFIVISNWTYSQKTEIKTIYIIGGIASTVTKNDLDFSKKYNIHYHDFGCIMPLNYKEYEKLNILVFEYLKVKFGEKWEKEINTNALGLTKWLKKIP